MTKEITKAIILQEMQDKLKLREFAPANFLFDETVVPIYNIGPHLEHWRTKLKTTSVSATGGVWFFTVPPTERWRIRRYDVIFMAAGAYTVAGAYVERLDKDDASSTVYLDLTAGQTVSYHVDLIEPIQLESNDVVRINIDGYISTANLRMIIDYAVEEIR